MKEDVFCAALQGILSNPNFFGATMQGSKEAAISFARECAEKAHSVWCDIETAPKTGIEILICDDRAIDGDIQLVSWNDYTGRWDRKGSTKYDWTEKFTPTHWAAIHTPPKRVYE